MAAVLVQVIISMIAFLVPTFSEALQSIQNITDLDVSKLEETAGLRLNGFGSFCLPAAYSEACHIHIGNV